MKQISKSLILILIIFLINIQLANCDTYIPAVQGQKQTIITPTQLTINGKLVVLTEFTFATIPIKVVNIENLYISPLPAYCELDNVTVVSVYIIISTSVKCYVEVSDGYSKTIKCYYYYSQIPFTPVKGSKISLWGKPWATPKIDTDGFTITK